MEEIVNKIQGNSDKVGVINKTFPIRYFSYRNRSTESLNNFPKKLEFKLRLSNFTVHALKCCVAIMFYKKGRVRIMDNMNLL